MEKAELNYLIYTDFYRVYRRNISIKDKIKIYLNINIPAGLRVMFFLRKIRYSYEKKSFLFKLKEIRFNRLCQKHGIEISPLSKIGKGFVIYHTNGIVLHPNTSFGDNCSVLQQVTVGNNGKKSRDQVAVIGNNVLVGAGAKIIGPINIGDSVRIGANAVVVHDCPDNSVVAGVPARVLSNEVYEQYNVDYLPFEEWVKR